MAEKYLDVFDQTIKKFQSDPSNLRQGLEAFLMAGILYVLVYWTYRVVVREVWFYQNAYTLIDINYNVFLYIHNLHV